MVEPPSLIVLAGGLGTRLRAVQPNVPKPMALVAGRPFLDWILRYWMAQGVRDFVLSTGYRSDVIRAFLDQAPFPGARIRQYVESGPLGTGGAIRAAAQGFDCSDPFLVANGDSLVLADLRATLPALVHPDADAVIFAVAVEDASRFGSLEIGSHRELLGFREKAEGGGLINAGVYLLSRRVLRLFPPGDPLSMETQVFPALLRAGARIRVEPLRAPFLDIGTPESCAMAAQFVLSNITRFGMQDHEPVPDHIL